MAAGDGLVAATLCKVPETCIWPAGISTASLNSSKLGRGSRELDACPMDGGGLAHRGGTTVTAWGRDHTVIWTNLGGRKSLPEKERMWRLSRLLPEGHSWHG
jgi:hypothetical protein